MFEQKNINMDTKKLFSNKTKVIIILAIIDILMIAIIGYSFDYTYFVGMTIRDGMAYSCSSYFAFFIFSYILAWLINKIFIGKKGFINLIAFILATIFILFSLYNKVIEKNHRETVASAFQIDSNNPRETINNMRNIPALQNDDVVNFIAKFTADNATIIFEMFEKKKFGESLITAEILKSKDAITKSITDGSKIIASMNEEIIHKELVQIFSDLEDKFTSQCMQSFNDEAVCNEGKRRFHNAIENNIQIIKEVILMKKDIFEQEIALLQFTKQHYSDLNSHSNQMELQNRIDAINKTQENINLRVQQSIDQYNQNMKAIFKKHGYSSGQ